LYHSTINLYLLHSLNALSGNKFLDNIIWHLGESDVPREVILISPYIFFWFSSDSAKTRTKLLSGLFGGILAVIVARCIAHFAPFEVRPMYDAASGFHQLDPGFQPGLETWNAFPSDTAAFSVALTLGLFSVHRMTSLILTFVCMVLFGISRVYLGIHYPFDVLAGWLVGAGCAAIVSLRSVQPAVQHVLSLQTRAPSLFYVMAFLALAEMSQLFENIRGFLRLLRLIA